MSAGILPQNKESKVKEMRSAIKNNYEKRLIQSSNLLLRLALRSKSHADLNRIQV